jgi:K+-transporting ATPase A subunit
MLIGAIDPLEGSLIILPAAGLVALGALLGKSRHRRLLCWSFILVAVGIGALWVLSAFGGVGGRTGRSMWWLLVVLPYPVG